MSTIKRKYCNLHGWAPHSWEVYVEGLGTESTRVFCICQCNRCHPPGELSEGKRILAKLRGFRLHKSMTAKAFLASKSKQEIV